jgi:hypothetical protein
MIVAETVENNRITVCLKIEDVYNSMYTNKWAVSSLSYFEHMEIEAYSHYPKQNCVKQHFQLLIELSCSIVLCSMTYLHIALLWEHGAALTFKNVLITYPVQPSELHLHMRILYRRARVCEHAFISKI